MFGILHSKKGFTLVELIVVVIIVGILASVAIPMMSTNTSRAKRTEAVAAMGAIRTAERMVKAEHGAYEAVTAGDFSATNLNKYFGTTDLNGRYYNQANYSVTAAGNINVTNPTGGGGACNMDVNGVVSE